MRWLQQTSQIFLLFTCTGCATIINGQRQEIEVTSTPSGAIVTDGIHIWRTPVTISLERRSHHLLAFFHEGYRPKTVHIERRVSAVIMGDFLLPGSIVFWGVDAISGSQWRLIPEAVNVELEPLPDGAELDSDSEPACNIPADQVK